jgi:diamine N-acetyltransferase
MNSVLTRIATISDAMLIADLSRKTFYDAFAKDNTKENMDQFMNEVFTRESLIKEVEEGDGIFLLAFINEEAVGYARMREKNKENIMADVNAIEIVRIYATQESVGKGVGKALMEHCLQIAHEQKKDVIWLGVWEKNERAIAFYKKHGFEKFGEHVFMLGSDPQTDWLMKKILIITTSNKKLHLPAGKGRIAK